MGGVAGVRGYTDGESYGDTGWRVSIEPRTPLFNIGMVDGDVPFWVRSSVFWDYGELYMLDKPAGLARDHTDFMGCGWTLTANIGSHLDGRLTLAFPLISTPTTTAGDFHFYFAVGAQF
jgi:hemolysin activation/secretion protein